MRKFLLTVGIFILLFGEVLAQNRTITGTVKDANGAPVPSASVIVKGLTKGTSSSSDGSFKIIVPASAKSLVISGIGFGSVTVNIEGNSDLGTITLQASNKNLDEVVVVAYGASKKTNITGSVATVSGVQLADKPFSSVDKTLQGSVAGMQVSSTSGAPGSATSIVIRGIGSITASSSPLWVIDGVIATTGDLTVNTTSANVLSTINPDDIESISVLKDAASTSVYGSRAANGVILVTTKKGKAGKTHLNFSTEIGQNSNAYSPTNKPLTSVQSQTVLRESLINAGYATDDASADALITDPVNGLGILSNYTSVNTNWLDVVTQKGNQSQYNLSLNGGNDKTQFYASAGYFNQIGTTIATDFKRWNGSISVTHKASDRVTFSASLNGSSTYQHTPSNGGTFANPVLASFFLLPWYTPYNTDGSLRYNDDLGEFPANGGLFNPVVQAAYNKNNTRQTSVRGNVAGELKILQNLKFTSRYAAEYFDVSEDQYRNPFYGDGYAAGGDAYSAYQRVFDWTWTNFLDLKQNINRNGDFYFDFKLGYEAQQYNYYSLQAGGQAFPKTLSLQYLASTATPTTAYALPSGTATTSEFAIGDINYKDKYVLSGSFRRDGSSVFGANHRYGNFYSVGGTWNINEENFLKDVNLVSLLKLRASYGENGNSLGFGFYTPLATYGYGNNYTGLPGSGPNNVGNPNLTWEKNKVANIGLDLGLLKDRITATIEYYHRTTSDLLLAVPLSLTSGFSTQNQNVGSMVNKGFEFTLGLKPIVTKDFSWSISFNIAHNINRVTALYLNNPIPSTQGNFEYAVGHDLLTYYLRQWAGVDPATGAPQWYADSSLKTITGTYGGAKQVLRYSASPKVYGGLTNTFTYKGLTLDVQFNYNYGNYVYDTWGSYLNSEGLYLGSFNQMNNELKAWKNPGDKTNVPQIIFGGNNNSYRGSTRYLYKGDYIRLRNIQLSYSLPQALLKKVHINNLSLYVRGTNLLTFGTAKDLPYDPESGIYSRTNLEVFIPKTITGGIKIGL
ncbi:MAG: TonB-dependent receptor [Bacteroidetes bacterium]|nr:TonB-dependent receptor [Bacteroidota bacterium]